MFDNSAFAFKEINIGKKIRVKNKNISYILSSITFPNRVPSAYACKQREKKIEDSLPWSDTS